MKTFKKIDTGISTVLIIFFLAACLARYDEPGYFELLITGYFVVGGWQVTSMLVHIFYRRSLPLTKTRTVYHVITLISLVTIPGSFWILVFIAPFMAIFYTWLCYDELRRMNERPLSMLK